MVRARVMHTAISTMFDGTVHHGEAIVADETGAIAITIQSTEMILLDVFKDLKIGEVCSYEYLVSIANYLNYFRCTYSLAF